jgi:hypothetical protein
LLYYDPSKFILKQQHMILKRTSSYISMHALTTQLKKTGFVAIAFIGLVTASRGEIGQWDFNAGTLAKTPGTDLDDLQYMDGDGGATQLATTFGTTSALGIPSINGTNASVMAFPACTVDMGYVMPTPSSPNGIDSPMYVNSYTLIMDLLYTDSAANSWRALIQTDPSNGNDADFFINPNHGIGISGNYSGTILSNTWHRVGMVFDKTNSELRKYIDGHLVGTQSYPDQDGRFSLNPAATALIFTDNDGDTAPGFVNSIQLRDWALTSAEMIAIGGPSATGIPIIIPSVSMSVTVSPSNQTDSVGMAGTYFTASAVGPGTLTYQWYRDGKILAGKTSESLQLTNLQVADAGAYTVVVNNGTSSVTSSPASTLVVTPTPVARVMGQWDFNQGDLRATLGQPLAYFDSLVQADVSFGSTTSFGISDIGGQATDVMYWSTLSPSTGGFVMTHGMAPNGGGSRVNQYTVIMDLLYPGDSSGYRALWQTDPSNTTDADLFLNSANGIGISQTYDGAVTPDAWHRIVFTVDLTSRELGKYIDGTNMVATSDGTQPFGPHTAQYLSQSTDTNNGGAVDMRWSLGPTALLFADNDNEVNQVYVSSIQIRDGRMSDASIAALGGATAHKIPGFIKAAAAGNNVIIDWTGNVLETASNVAGPWSEVQGASHPYSAVTAPGSRFFRVAR